MGEPDVSKRPVQNVLSDPKSLTERARIASQLIRRMYVPPVVFVGG